MTPTLTLKERGRRWLRPPRVFATAYVALSLLVHFALKAYVAVHLARDVRTTVPISAPEIVEYWSPAGSLRIFDIIESPRNRYHTYRGVLVLPAGTTVYRARSTLGHDYLCMSGQRQVCAPLFHYFEGTSRDSTWVAHDGEADATVRFFHSRWTVTPYLYPIGWILGV